MPAGSRARRETTDEWAQLRLLVTSREQETYELLRPAVVAEVIRGQSECDETDCHARAFLSSPLSVLVRSGIDMYACKA
jgi:hypothetical protein